MKHIDTIVTDMDGTLLRPDRTLSPYTLRVMKECIRRGIRVIPCSGRTAASMRPYLEQLDTGMPYIGGNGSEIIGADHQMLEQLTFDPALTREIVAFFQSENCYVQLFCDDAFYYEVECEQSESYRQASGLKAVAVGDFSACPDLHVPKILAINTPDKVERLFAAACKRFEGRALFVISEPEFVDAGPLGGGKGEALRRLAARCGDILPERTLVFGDSQNDLSLLSFTPHSVAMGNAREDVKAQAAYVCASNSEDGMARFVEEHVLANQ